MSSELISEIRQSPWFYRREVRCSSSGDEISNPGLNCTIVSLHCLLTLLLGFLFQLYNGTCARALFIYLFIYLFKLRVHLVCLITA